MPIADHRWRARLGALLVFGPLIVLQTGCPSRNAPARTTPEVEREDELAAVRDTLRREARLENCRTAVAQLNVYLSRTTESRPAALTSAERELFSGPLHLTPEELGEVAREDFSALDAHYLEECFLVHDAVRSLKLDYADRSAAAVLERARLAFAWAMRQVWLLDVPGKPAPTATVLRPGYGSAAERAGVALAVFQQAGLDAGLIGEARDERALRSWAVGVLAGNEVYLFDPRGGQPVASAEGKGVATLSQARANPALVKVLVEAGDVGVDVAAAVKASRVWLSPPLSALAPRMRWLQEVLPNTPPAVFGVDAIELSARFAKAGEKAGFWNPPLDAAVTGPMRRLVGALPPSEGGQERGGAGERLYARYRAGLIPLEQLPRPLRQNIVIGEPRERMLQLFSARFIEMALEPGKPRDLLLRGQFDEASRSLADTLTNIANVQQRIGQEEDLEKDSVKWAEDMRSAYAAYIRMRDNPKPGDDVVAAKARVDGLYKEATKIVLLIEQSVAEPYAGSVTFELALCTHEQAERRSRDRSAAATKREAWENAAGWWNNYLRRVGRAAWVPANQIDHARQMLAAVQRELALLPP